MAVLTASRRAKLKPSQFALPGGHYPIDTANRARNALARVSQYGTPEEKATVRAAVHKRYPGIAQEQAHQQAVRDGMNHWMRGK